jgi:stage V sporulation protein R
MPILLGDRVPGIKMPESLRKRIPELIQACKDEGLNPFNLIYDVFSYDEIAEIVAYTGFPVRYPHYKFGESYEEMARGQEYGWQKVYELVVNSDPCYVYLLENNPLVDQITVIVHALAHSDFFRNNIFFSKTNRNMLNEMASHGSRIRKYCRKFGRETVTDFLDNVLSIQNLIDPAKLWSSKKYREPAIHDKIEHHEPIRINVDDDSHYMDKFINPEEFLENQRKKLETDFKGRSWPEKPEKDVLGFLMTYAPLRQWQRDIIGMIREESYYFLPQRVTKIINEGWASYWDSHMMAKKNMAGDDGIVDYAIHKAGTLGGKYSTNPYKLGYNLLLYAEDCYNKGRVSGSVHPEWNIRWDDCDDMEMRKKWDLKWNKGREKIFEIRENYNDALLIGEFMTQDFCEEYEYFSWEKNERGEYVIASRDAEKIREQLLKRMDNFGTPVIRLIDANVNNKGIFLLEHTWNGDALNDQMAELTLQRIYKIWKRPVAIKTKDEEYGDPFYVVCEDNEDMNIYDEEEFEEKFKS